MAPQAMDLVGRAGELGTFERLLEQLAQGQPFVLEVAGEPGIGKTRLLQELAARALARGYLVFSGTASEPENDLPFSVFIDALDEHIGQLEMGPLGLDEETSQNLARVFPSQRALKGRRNDLLALERHRSHRAVRTLLERLATAEPTVLILDDMQWADAASVELLGALMRHPPAASVALAVAVRPRQTPEALSKALARQHREKALTHMELGALSPSEASEVVGDAFEPAQMAALYQESGGNPFYLEELSRALDRTTGSGYDGVDLSLAIEVPPAVAAALTEEIALVSDKARLVLQGSAVAGDTFDPELSAAAAGMTEGSTMDALDELLERDLIRQGDLPRRFRFRHPIVRRAVYETTSGGWRLGAHERCAEALTARGASATTRAYHTERSAREGDLAAVAVLREAGGSVARLAPSSAAHWYAGALRLLPQTASPQERVDLLFARGEALAAAGRFSESHRALLDAAASVPPEASQLRTTLTIECARMEHRLGRYEQAHRRLVEALSRLPVPTSVEAAELLIELALNEFYRSRYISIHDWAGRAVNVAKALGEAPLQAAALAMPALADAMTGPSGRTRSFHARATALVDSLPDEELARRLDALAWLAAAELYSDMYREADAHASRALTLARTTGQGELFLVLNQILGRVWYVRGRLAEATGLLDGAIESARLLSATQALAGNLFNRSAVAIAVGDMDMALATAEESVELARDLDDGFVKAWAAVRLADALLETEQPSGAMELLLGSAGGEELTSIPGGWRAYCLELLTRCWLALDRSREAETAAALAEATSTAVQLPLAAAWADRAAAAVALHAGDTDRTIERAFASANAARRVGAPIEGAKSRLLAGQALAQDGQSERAVEELRRSAAAFDACGALRYRQRAERELGKLGRRPHRRTRPGLRGGAGIESLTGRELQVARLVVDRKTNAQIAAELFLSKKTVETHLRNTFRKMQVTTRVDLARALERAEGTGH